ncbi:MAG TPA: CinA family nicotinamide mononucleotide deamidase-related protein, partial [Acidimicrobiales bacterium]|nr:CinA family nicotinamide mononucleotide deamidase-related protein [Acidimicrobiales bacterium]
MPLRVEIVAVGTELLLGQVVDTNSTYISEQLAANGLDCHFQTRVGDNHARIVLALRTALARSEAVIACGGLGPTQDDITREAIAEVMNVPLRRDPQVLEAIRAMFASRNRAMPENNGRQADVPEGAALIHQTMGTAPGLICPVGQKVVYAMPGVPYEMHDMMTRAVLPDLLERSGEKAVIASRTLRTWGLSESGLAELIAPRIDELEQGGLGVPTIAFLASGIEGMKLRLTVKAADAAAAAAALDAEEVQLRALIGRAVFGVDEETMECAIGNLLLGRNLTLAVAESLTGGLLASRIVSVAGASRWFRG